MHGEVVQGGVEQPMQMVLRVKHPSSLGGDEEVGEASSRSALSVFKAKEEQIDRKKMEVREKVFAQLGRVEEESKRLAFIRQELEGMADPTRKEVEAIQKRIDTMNRQLKPLSKSCVKKEKEYREILEASIPACLSPSPHSLVLAHLLLASTGEHASMSTERERLDEIGKKIKREPDAAGVVVAASPTEHHVPRRLGLGGALNTVTPCAACKLLRRRCAQECPFAPYFSPHEPHKFAAVHKVFGASNVSKMLLEVAESERADAASSLVYEANLRLRDPVYGCMGAISMLQQQLNALEGELEAVRAEIFKHRYRQASAGAAGLMDDVHAAAVFAAPAPSPVHAGDVVSVAEAGQEVAAGAGAPGMSAVYATGQPSSTDDYRSLNTSEHDAYFG